MVEPEVTTDPVPEGYSPVRITFALPPDTHDAELRALAIMLAAWDVASRELSPAQKDRAIDWLRGRLSNDKNIHDHLASSFQPHDIPRYGGTVAR